jgi:hypothetical protein
MWDVTGRHSKGNLGKLTNRELYHSNFFKQNFLNFNVTPVLIKEFSYSKFYC